MSSLYFLLLIIVIVFYFTIIYGYLKMKLSRYEIWFGIVYIFSLITYALSLSYFSIDYTESVDDSYISFYTPFSNNHLLSLFFFITAFIFSCITIWSKGRYIPPLLFFICISFIVLGQMLSVLLIFHTYTNIALINNGINFGLLLYPILNIILSLKILISVSKQEIVISKSRTYQHQILEKMNMFLQKRENDPLWFLILLIPVFISSILILVLFGQDSDSLIKVFTETSTWHFSQKTHPPILDHKGHYLCTVAALGTPKIVKPIRLGTRNGHIIIINRQLQIANAFEELIMDWSPIAHQFIRKNYDNYGYPLSILIQKPIFSNITYLLMKPIEWGFLIVLYLFCIKPEAKIKKQYLFQ